jgi:hypothetical protein
MSYDLNLNELIGSQVGDAAEWRRRKAAEFPNDARNLRAAEELENLAAQIEGLEGSEIHQQLSALASQIDWSEANFSINEDLSAELRSIGFHGSYSSAAQFLEWYRDLLKEQLEEQLDAAVPVPSLDEQVENDPAVKAAKKAYEQTRAKALAEARKKL